ncbi:MAG TPA: DUF2270 domain-containing protein [Blastocatellia bacterium]|nr:DUF2270 domain-containing protein [Blastocatellia bacterium]
MITEREVTIKPEPPAKAAQPIFPTNSVEFVNSLAHYYRGELSRMMSWRDRLDRTTNWAIAAVAAMLSVSLSTPQSHHGVLLFAMLLVFLLLHIEARRYRFFHVYRSRVRLLERNYYARIFSPREMIDPAHWMSQLGDDLRLPRFSMTRMQAMARRLRRNYIWLYLILMLAWLLKTTTSGLQPDAAGGAPHLIHSADEWSRNAAIGYVPGWIVLIGVLSFYGWIFYIMFKHRETTGELAYGEVHV